MIKEVMERERDAVSKMIEETTGQYEEILTLFSECSGRLVFMGVGKSGHIAGKLAATFASLGIPATFVHSTEAMHGDLGMIGGDDIAILISNSGNTQEVVQNIAPLKRNGVTTVAFTANKESALAELCDYRIFYPKLAEADRWNLAPTVSSTLTLVLGDAIACELSCRKEFTRGDFYKYHPNGSLGAMLKKEHKQETYERDDSKQEGHKKETCGRENSKCEEYEQKACERKESKQEAHRREACK